jgi:hypothetical protein
MNLLWYRPGIFFKNKYSLAFGYLYHYFFVLGTAFVAMLL